MLALQGSFAEHTAMLRSLGCEVFEIRSLADVERFRPQGFVMPGGESTTMMKFLTDERLLNWFKSSVKKGMPVLATCAGLILLSRSHLNLLDIGVDRNAYGNQLDSFETDLAIFALGKKPFHSIFIRAPKIKKVYPKAKILAYENKSPVFVQQENILGLTFHPELTGDTRMHEYFLGLV